MQNLRKNLIVEMTFQFSLDVIEFTEKLEEFRKYVIARQLLKSGTSIGANVREAQNAESKADFVHKMKIALKEADETIYWLLLCREAKKYPFEPTLLEKAESVNKVLTKIVGTAKRGYRSSEQKSSSQFSN